MIIITKKLLLLSKFASKIPEVKQLSKSHLKRKIIGSFFGNPVQGTETEKLIIKINLEKALALAIFELRF